jgi:hypothetical protein
MRDATMRRIFEMLLMIGDRRIDTTNAVVEPLSFCSTTGQDEYGTFPVVAAKNRIGE